MNSTLSTFNTMTEVPLSKAPNPQLLPGRWSNGCPLLRVRVHSVCVHLDGLNAEHQFRVWVTILDNTSHYYWLKCSNSQLGLGDISRLGQSFHRQNKLIAFILYVMADN